MTKTVELDEELLDRAMRSTNSRTEQEAVEALLRKQLNEQGTDTIGDLWGIGWEGDLDAMRQADAPADWHRS